MATAILSSLKICTKCAEQKPIIEFSKHSQTACGLNPSCKTCDSAKAKLYRANNAQHVKEQDAKNYLRNIESRKASGAAWRAKNKDKKKLSDAAYQAGNKEKLAFKRVAWYMENKEKVKAKVKAWGESNPEKLSESSVIRVARWRKNNPDRTREIVHNYRAKKRANGGKLSKNLVAKLFKLQRGKCACCNLTLGGDYHMDHIMPISLGGSNTDDNIQLLRQRCNNQKNAKHPIDFMQSRGFLL